MSDHAKDARWLPLREDRNEAGRWCDKAWHMPGQVPATHKLRCADCGKWFARCDRCNRTKPVRSSMLGHLGVAHRQNRDFKQRVLPGGDEDVRGNAKDNTGGDV